MKNNTQPTQAQIQYAQKLMQELGYDESDYEIESMTKAQVSKLISELKDELEG